MTATTDCGAAIRAARRDRGLSMRALAQRVGVSPATISAVENGRTGVSIARLHAYADALGLPVTRLLQAPGVITPDRVTPPEARGSTWRSFPPLQLDVVLAAAIEAFVATGYHGSSMRDIAARAHLSVPGVYHHYPDKQHLLVAALDLTMGELSWRVEAARRDASDGATEVALIVEALALFHTHRRTLAFIGASEMRSLTEKHRTRIIGDRNRIQYRLDAAIDRATGASSADEDARRIAGRAIATMCTALAQWFSPDGPATPEEIAGRYADYALALLGVQRSVD